MARVWVVIFAVGLARLVWNLLTIGKRETRNAGDFVNGEFRSV